MVSVGNTADWTCVWEVRSILIEKKLPFFFRSFTKDIPLYIFSICPIVNLWARYWNTASADLFILSFVMVGPRLCKPCVCFPRLVHVRLFWQETWQENCHIGDWRGKRDSFFPVCFLVTSYMLQWPFMQLFLKKS